MGTKKKKAETKQKIVKKAGASKKRKSTATAVASTINTKNSIMNFFSPTKKRSYHDCDDSSTATKAESSKSNTTNNTNTPSSLGLLRIKNYQDTTPYDSYSTSTASSAFKLLKGVLIGRPISASVKLKPHVKITLGFSSENKNISRKHLRVLDILNSQTQTQTQTKAIRMKVLVKGEILLIPKIMDNRKKKLRYLTGDEFEMSVGDVIMMDPSNPIECEYTFMLVDMNHSNNNNNNNNNNNEKQQRILSPCSPSSCAVIHLTEEPTERESSESTHDEDNETINVTNNNELSLPNVTLRKKRKKNQCTNNRDSLTPPIQLELEDVEQTSSLVLLTVDTPIESCNDQPQFQLKQQQLFLLTPPQKRNYNANESNTFWRSIQSSTPQSGMTLLFTNLWIHNIHPNVQLKLNLVKSVLWEGLKSEDGDLLLDPNKTELIHRYLLKFLEERVDDGDDGDDGDCRMWSDWFKKKPLLLENHTNNHDNNNNNNNPTMTTLQNTKDKEKISLQDIVQTALIKIITCMHILPKRRAKDLQAASVSIEFICSVLEQMKYNTQQKKQKKEKDTKEENEDQTFYPTRKRRTSTRISARTNNYYNDDINDNDNNTSSDGEMRQIIKLTSSVIILSWIHFTDIFWNTTTSSTTTTTDVQLQFSSHRCLSSLSQLLFSMVRHFLLDNNNNNNNNKNDNVTLLECTHILQDQFSLGLEEVRKAFFMSKRKEYESKKKHFIFSFLSTLPTTTTTTTTTQPNTNSFKELLIGSLVDKKDAFLFGY